MKKVNKLYYFSENNHNGEIMIPYIPSTIVMGEYGDILEMEERETKRVPFSKTISGAFLSINFDGRYEELFVFYLDDLLIIQVGNSDEGPKYIAYEKE